MINMLIGNNRKIEFAITSLTLIARVWTSTIWGR